MPKLIKPHEDKEKNILQSNIEYLCKMQGVSEKSLSATAQLSEYQYRQRRKDPGNYTYDNLLRIAKRLHTRPIKPIEKETGKELISDPLDLFSKNMTKPNGGQLWL